MTITGQALRDSPPGFLRANGTKDPADRDSVHPEEAQFFRAVSKEQADQIRKPIDEMLH